jgi:hypothetical protein
MAEVKVNGREIKNILKVGALMAEHKGEALSLVHLETAVEATQFLGSARREGEKVRSSVFN